jgi:hypothetical protein
MELIAFPAEKAEDLSETVVLLLGPLDHGVEGVGLGHQLAGHLAQTVGCQLDLVQPPRPLPVHLPKSLR